MANNIDVIKNKKFRQSNHLIESPHAQEFSVHEIKLFEFSVASCTQDDYVFVQNKSDKEFYLSSSELANILNTSVSVISHEIEKTAKRIMTKMLHLRKELSDGSIQFELINIIPYARYMDGVFKFRLNYSIIPYLIEIKEKFTEFQLSYLLAMNSASAIKLYKLLFQYKQIKSRVFTVDDLKSQFGLHSKYKQYNDFKKNIISPSVLQINAKTDLYVTFNEIKFGRKVEKIKFEMKLQNKPIHPDFIDKETLVIDVKQLSIIENPELSGIDKLLSGIESELSDKTKKLIAKVYKENGVEYVEASIKYATKHSKSNLDKYLHDTLVNRWADVEVQKILNKKTEEQKQLQIAKQKQQESNAKLQANEQKKLMIVVEWNNLTNEQQEKYTKYATNLINIYNQKLKIFPTIVEDLPICCFAVSQNKSYNLSIEGFCKTLLNEVLHVV